MADQLLTGTTLIEDTRKDFGRVWSIPGIAFTAAEPDVDDIAADGDRGNWVATGTTTDFLAPVNLPHGVKVKSVIVTGTDVTDTWFLRRMTLSSLPSGVENLATAALNTEDTVISNDVIDNISYAYFLFVGIADAGDRLWGARIIYD